jgi:hypothetical protein
MSLENQFQDFVTENCKFHSDAYVVATEFRLKFIEYINNITPNSPIIQTITTIKFNKIVVDQLKNVQPKRGKNKHVYKGITLLSNPTFSKKQYINGPTTIKTTKEIIHREVDRNVLLQHFFT